VSGVCYLMLNGYSSCLLVDSVAASDVLSAHLFLVPRSRMHGIIPPSLTGLHGVALR